MKGAIDTGKLRPNTGRTNQKLYFAKLQLDRLQQVLADRSAFAWEAEALSCREAAILHLHGAYVAFLQELVRFYKLGAPLQTSEQLRLAMEARGQVSPEVVVLQNLEKSFDSWLAALLRAHQQCLVAPDPVAPAAPEDEGESPGRAISLVTVSTDEPLSAQDVKHLHDWHRELVGIIREFRREMEEF